MPPTGEHADISQIRAYARRYWNIEELRHDQERAISALLEGRDVLAIMPTGAGKSAIYQIAGLLISGPTVVISPLLALQQDQTESIEEHDAGGAAVVNSTISASERTEAFSELRHRGIEFLFLAPEQFHNDEVIERLRAARPSLFVVDEAHCISEWGHDFRPDYLRLGLVIEGLGHPRVLALTATAALPVRREIVERLGMHDPLVLVSGFDRPNIWLGVERFHDESTKLQALVERVADAPKSGIVYAATHKHAEEVAAALQAASVRAAAYHAGLHADERERIQNAFMNDEIEVIVATTAFGMGIDKPNVRFVFHYDISDSVDSYYQEIGRAGRDGAPARAILFYRPEDLSVRRFLSSGGKLSEEEAERVAEAVLDERRPVGTGEIQHETHLTMAKITTALSRLDDAGVIETLPTGEVIPVSRNGSPEDMAGEAVEAQERYREYMRSRLDMMQGYAEVGSCRREYLLNYFGEQGAGQCEACDLCQSGQAHEQPANAPFPVGSRVVHPRFGLGRVMRYEGDMMTVLFDEVGYKSLATDLVVSEKLLKPAA